MALGKKGSAMIVYLMIAILVFIMAANFAKPIKEEVTVTMNSSNLDCTNSTISSYTRATCTVVDMGWFYFLGACIAAGMALLAGQKEIGKVLQVIFVFVVVIVLITPLKDIIIQFRNASHLNCAGAGITIGAKALCIFVDVWLFWFVATALVAAATYFYAKKIIPLQK